ncbi:hypothetical protein [Paraburkholderia ribeironis]|uniref:hypothetical protein n=1 Tax=Paraburkholderia ribeironis TaxID=1247936 RepID=UPI001C3F6425|nr:hypothetical protein [Paraburkholderia ribeironis]
MANQRFDRLALFARHQRQRVRIGAVYAEIRVEFGSDRWQYAFPDMRHDCSPRCDGLKRSVSRENAAVLRKSRVVNDDFGTADVHAVA